jgi:hypothetical protein
MNHHDEPSVMLIHHSELLIKRSSTIITVDLLVQPVCCDLSEDDKKYLTDLKQTCDQKVCDDRGGFRSLVA